MKTCPRRNFLQHWATDFCHCDRSSNSLPREFSARFQPVKSTVKVRWFNGVMNCLSRCKNTTSSFPIKPTIDFLRAPAASSEAPFFPFRFGTNCKFPDRIDRDSPTRTVLSYPCVIFHDATRTLSRVSPGDTFLFSFFFLFFFSQLAAWTKRRHLVSEIKRCVRRRSRSFTVADVWWEYPTKCRRASLTRFRCAAR